MHSETPSPWGGTTVHVRSRAVTPRERRTGSRRLGVLLALVLALVAVLAFLAVRELGPRPGHDEAASDPGCHLAHCHGNPGVSGAPITRAEVAARAHRWLNHTGIRYSSTTEHYGPGGWGLYRRDCSGFVTMALHLPDDNGGASTVGLADDVVAVAPRNLRPYDVIGRLGPHSGGENGHVQLFLGWVGRHHARVRVAEQGGLSDQARWPHEATYQWPERMTDGAVLGAYRYVHIEN